MQVYTATFLKCDFNKVTAIRCILRSALKGKSNHNYMKWPSMIKNSRSMRHLP